MAATVDEQPVLPALKPGQLRVLIRGNGVKRSESAKTKWQPRYFHLVEVGAEDPDQEPDLQFRWGVDEDQLQTPRCKSISVSMLTDVEIGAASDNIKWPYPFAADYNTCFKLSTAKRQYNWAAFPSGKASALRAKLSIELLKQNATEGKQPRLGTMRSLTAAAKSGVCTADVDTEMFLRVVFRSIFVQHVFRFIYIKLLVCCLTIHALILTVQTTLDTCHDMHIITHGTDGTSHHP
eukprot:m.36766 g.36766  ORF g.36766 m.36766 type:complete len:236 (+) comp5438_c0_seq2:49-756(+)